jgi:hypothetical protein
VGWGKLAQALFNRFFPSNGVPLSLSYFGLIGIVAVGFLAGVVNLFFALKGELPLIVCLVGLVGLVLSPGTWFRSDWLRELGLMGFLLVLIVATTFHSEFVYDAGLYHLPSIRWFLESAIPLGLGNVNSYAGYNSSWFLVSAAVSIPSKELMGIGVAESLALLFFFSFLLQPFCFSQRSYEMAHWYRAGLFIVLIVSGFESGAGSNSTDVPMTVFLLAASVLFLEKRYLSCALFAAFSFFIKLSAAPVAVSLIGLCLFWGTRIERIWIAGVAGLILGLCLLRGFLLSGCALYPEENRVFFRSLGRWLVKWWLRGSSMCATVLEVV